MSEQITLTTPLRTVAIANSWQELTPDVFKKTVGLLSLHAAGEATAEDVNFLYVCSSLGVDPLKLDDDEVMGNLLVLAKQIKFIFDDEEKPTVIFPAQLIPTIDVKGVRRWGYKVRTDFDTLTTTLTASQFIDAHEVIKAGSGKLPLLASILYHNGEKYNSQRAHTAAGDFESLDALTLQSIAVNFQAFIGFLFTRTHFSLLSESQRTSTPEISTGLSETLYNLCADGLGNIDDMKQMPLIEFLTILRKKLIESVNAMHAAGMNMAELVDKTGLKSRTIKKLLYD